MTRSRVVGALGAASVAAVLLAVWRPVGSWWQWLATAAVLVFVTALVGGQPLAARKREGRP